MILRICFEPKNQKTVFAMHWFEPVNQETTFLLHWFEPVNQKTLFCQFFSNHELNHEFSTKNQLIFCFFANLWPKISSKFRFEMGWTLPKLASIIQLKTTCRNYLIDLKFCCFRQLVTNYWLCNSDMLRLELFLASNKALRNHRFRLIVILLVFARLCISLTLELYASSKTCYFFRKVAFCG